MAVEFSQNPGSGKYAEDQRAPIADLEHEVDHLRHDCIQRLNNTFVTPIMFDRPDILDLSQALDDVVDNIRAAVDRTALYQPQSIPAPMLKLATILVECTEALAGACTELHALRTAGGADRVAADEGVKPSDRNPIFFEC